MGKLQDCNYNYKEIPEKKRGRFNVDYNPDHPVSKFVVDNDLLVCQILSRLPVKSLVRFKCVCKGWKSVIEEDSHFINLHLTHSQSRPGLFILLPKSAAGKGYQTRDYDSFMLADLSFNGKPAKIHTTRKTKAFSYSKMLGPITGLVCFVKHCAVRIYNVSTREATPWIKSRVCVLEEKQNGSVHWLDEPMCYFGFDPTTRKHKALFVWSEGKFKGKDFPVCEVLTVGDKTWRIIDEVQPYRLSGTIHTYANGSIYWYMFHNSDDDDKPRFDCSDSEEVDEYSDESIMAFDIGSEKFRMVPIPEFTISNLKHCGLKFLEVDGCLAILRWGWTLSGSDIARMWKFHDHNKAYGISSIRSRDNWTQVSLTLPSYVLDSRFFFHSVPGKDQVILETYRKHSRYDRQSHVRNVKLGKFYSYNRKEKSVRKFRIDGISFVPEELTSDAVCTTFVESLLRVREKL